MKVGIAKRARQRALYCGDECGYWQNGGRTTLCIVDGLGHGESAEEAAKAAVDYVAHHLSESLRELFAGCNLALRNTRGVAMGVAIVDEDTRKLTYAAVGNTRAIIVGESIVHLASSNGIVGGGYKVLTSESFALRPFDLVILATDGVAEMRDISIYRRTPRAGLGKLAKRILQTWSREADDAAVLVFRSEG